MSNQSCFYMQVILELYNPAREKRQWINVICDKKHEWMICHDIELVIWIRDCSTFPNNHTWNTTNSNQNQQSEVITLLDNIFVPMEEINIE